MLGERVGNYRVVSELGSGGMGIVYRAVDETLGRDVAIKVLPATFGEDTDALERFLREARLLAQLNHPNIATIYDFEEVDGQKILVMELVEGETLAERLARGPIPVEEAMPLFIQVSEGLETAHEKGIVHRDLKPGNLKLTPAGKVKILDFGLARVDEADATLPDEEELPSPTPRKITLHGAILGTASYMSPEQARGNPVDKRTDIWALGCCLFETLTGRHAFAGETLTDVLAAVVKSEPDFSLVPGGVPVAVERALRRCLRKNPARRLHDVADLRIELEEASEGDGPRAGTTGAGTTDVVRRLEITLPKEHSLDRERALAMSPDGRRIAYSSPVTPGGELSIFVRELDRLEPRAVPGTERGRMPVFSPKGSEIAFHATTSAMQNLDDGKIWRIPVEGGTPVEVTPARSAWWAGMDWGPDDTLIFSEGPHGLARIPLGGEPETLTHVDVTAGERYHVEPRFLPGGDAVLFTVAFENNDVRSEVLSLETRERHHLEGVGAFARYAESGHLIFPTNGSILVVPFDPYRRRVLGRETALGFPVASRNNPWREKPHFFDWSTKGTLAYVPPDGIIEHKKSFVWLGRDGEKTPIPEVEEFDSREPWWDLSPNGNRLAFTSESYEIWLRELDGRGPPLRLTLGGDYRQPIWNPQGTRLAAVRGGAGVLDVVTFAGDGSETESKVAATFRRDQIGGYLFLYSWTPDENNILCHDFNSAWAVSADGSSEPRRLFDTKFHESYPVVSPDGSVLAYVSDRSGNLDIYLSPYPDAASKPPVRISRNGALEPRWSRDGRKLYFREGRLLVVAAIEAGGDGVRVGTEETLLELGVSRFAGPSYAVATDDRLIVLEDQASAERNRVVVVENWFQELERLAPRDR